MVKNIPGVVRFNLLGVEVYTKLYLLSLPTFCVINKMVYTQLISV